MRLETPTIGAAGVTIAAVVLLALAGARADEPPALSIQRAPQGVIWQGALHGVETRFGEPVFELSPDVGSILYYQGLPYPRLMRRSVAANGEGMTLGVSAPFTARRARFAPDATTVYFTVDTSFRPRRPLPPGRPPPDEAIRPAVARIGIDGSNEKRLLAPAILLDVHPVGGVLLVGIPDGLRESTALTGEYRMGVEELIESTGERAPLGIEIAGGALIRYSWDGTVIYFAPEPGAPEIRKYERRTGLHRKLDVDAERCGHVGGDAEIGRAAPRHLGSFGWDGHELTMLHRDLDDPGVPLEVPADFPGAAESSPRLHTLRGELALLSTGPADRRQLVVARLAADFDRLRKLGAALEVLDPRGRGARERLAAARASGDLRARAEGPAGALLRRVAATLRGEDARPIARVKARWELESKLPGEAIGRTVEIIESAAGAFRIEKITPPANEDDAPARELIVSDGRTATFTDDRDRVVSVSLRSLEGELAMFSPYRLLLDPAGLTLADLSFSADGPIAEGEPGRLRFRHLDGFHGSVEISAGEDPKPVAIETPLLFPSIAARRGFGKVPERKSVRFGDWRRVGGRLVPHRIEFENGVSDVALKLVELDTNPEETDAVFEGR